MSNGEPSLSCCACFRRLGQLRPEDVPSVLDAIAARMDAVGVRYHPDVAPLLPRHWRGRMGLDKEEQIELARRHSNYDAP